MTGQWRSRLPAPAPTAESPQVVFEELMEEIRHAIVNQPRNLQKRLGPSEIGDPCNRSLIARLMALPEPDEGPNWRAWVGTAMHAELERIFAASFMQNLAQPRFLLEKRVTVGRIGDWDLTGSCDLFDTLTGCVWDWKTKSMTQHQLARREGLSTKYRVQFHCYGMGMANAGFRVTSVGGIFLRRDGEFSDAFYLAEPYDPLIAAAALARANSLQALGELLGAAAAMDLYPHCQDEYCRVCGNYRHPFGAPRATSNSVRGLLAAAR